MRFYKYKSTKRRIAVKNPDTGPLLSFGGGRKFTYNGRDTKASLAIHKTVKKSDNLIKTKLGQRSVENSAGAISYSRTIRSKIRIGQIP